MIEKILQEINAIHVIDTGTGVECNIDKKTELSCRSCCECVKNVCCQIIRSHIEDDGWIPVEEGYPEKSGYYWAYFATPFSGYSKKVYWNAYDECYVWPNNGRKVKEDPVAWRLYCTPAPYRLKEEN